MLEVRDFGRRSIARKDDLFMAVEESVEGVKEFLLRTLFAAEELNVVDQEQVGLTITLPEFDQRTVLNRIDEIVNEYLAREVHHFRALFLRPDVLADRLHQVRLAETDAAVDEERVVSASRGLRDRETRGVRNLVVRADDKRIESVTRIQSESAAFAAGRRSFGFGLRRLRAFRRHFDHAAAIICRHRELHRARRTEGRDDRRV